MTKPEILVIDENTKILFAFESLLEREGCVTITAETAQEALLKIAARNPRIIFVDVSIPDENNLKKIQKIRERNLQIPLILITSQDDSDAEILVDKYHANGYLKKPISIANIRAILAEFKLGG